METLGDFLGCNNVELRMRDDLDDQSCHCQPSEAISNQIN